MIMIDKIELNKKIREKANFLLKDPHLMSETELQNKLRYFSEDAKDIAERILEEYIFSVFQEAVPIIFVKIPRQE